ncbi:cytochrome P450 [Streptomyces sp. T12]|nr:cytochrome P450 [Streptomyces sp. T12]
MRAPRRGREPLDEKTAAVELLNVVRPTTALAWFVAFAAHALHRWPGNRSPLADGDVAFATAFAHEVRRFCPFVPFLGGLAARDLFWRGAWVPAGGLVVLDVYGQNHDEALWGDPYAFRPRRFLGLLEALTAQLARMEYTVPEQNLAISLHRVPTLPHSGVVLVGVGRAAG